MPSRSRWAAVLAAWCALSVPGGPAWAQAPKRPARPAAPAPPPAPSFFTSALSLDEMKGKQAVLVTDHGEIVLRLLPEAAPNHVGYFINQAREGAYHGTTFHRLIKYGIIQGGDPISSSQERAGRLGLAHAGRRPRGRLPEGVVFDGTGGAGAFFLYNCRQRFCHADDVDRTTRSSAAPASVTSCRV